MFNKCNLYLLKVKPTIGDHKILSRILSLIILFFFSTNIVIANPENNDNSLPVSNLSFQADIYGDSTLETISYIYDLSFHDYGGFGINAHIVRSGLRSGDQIAFAVSRNDINSFVIGVSQVGANVPDTELVINRDQYPLGTVEMIGGSQLHFVWEVNQSGYHIKLHKNAQLLTDQVTSGFKFEEIYTIENIGSDFDIHYFIEYLHTDDDADIKDYNFDSIPETLLCINNYSTSGYPIFAKINLSDRIASYSKEADGEHVHIIYTPLIKTINPNRTIEISKSAYITSLAKDSNVAEMQIAMDASYILSQSRCEVPFYWQRDPNGIKDHPLRGGCGPDFDTIGEAGCLLTSATMLFRHYGAFFTKDGIEMTPPNLSDCMNDFACNYNWYKGAVCTGGKATFSEPWGSFSYAKLEEQLNTYNRPVILGMCQPKGNCNMNNYQQSHWVLVVDGQGTDPSNYVAWDPWFKCGQNITLYRRSLDWEFSAIAYYQGTPTCEFPTEAPICSEVNAVPLPTSSKSEESTSGFILPNFPQKSDVISGSVMLYRILDDTMIIEAAAESSVGNITDMLIWSDTTPNTIWQSFSPYIILPYSNRVYAQFRDDLGNVSEVYSDTPNPNAPPAGDNPFFTYLPVVNNSQGYSWIDATNGGTIVASGDDTYQYINIPFAFNFYGNFYTGLYVSSNGFISFGNGYSAPTNSCIPSSNNPNNAIYAFWDDLIPNGGGNGNIYVKQADVDTFVIEWHQVKRYGTSDYETFEIITKRDNSIKIQYKKISNVNSATVGIENSNGTLGVQYICNGIGNPLSNESMIFYTTQ
jgi:hypothetical protein